MKISYFTVNLNHAYDSRECSEANGGHTSYFNNFRDYKFILEYDEIIRVVIFQAIYFIWTFNLISCGGGMFSKYIVLLCDNFCWLVYFDSFEIY